jgi:membrane associated rhomboid family serine protease
MSLFLFANFANFLSCQIGLAVYGSYVEKLIGWKKLWMVGLVSGSAGILLSCSFFPTPHVNGSCSPVAYMGILFGYMCFKWEEWNYTGSGKW